MYFELSPAINSPRWQLQVLSFRTSQRVARMFLILDKHMRDLLVLTETNSRFRIFVPFSCELRPVSLRCVCRTSQSLLLDLELSNYHWLIAITIPEMRLVCCRRLSL
ncbi:NSs [Pacora virus]|uniref:NSs n=1 Tax=Pacora virus TaxID=2748244 RepID=A0A7D9MVV9_9VIRU|nr:NSs [Pacora virus]QLA47045.1 NSs [Pacora virus]